MWRLMEGKGKEEEERREGTNGVEEDGEGRDVERKKKRSGGIARNNRMMELNAWIFKDKKGGR